MDETRAWAALHRKRLFHFCLRSEPVCTWPTHGQLGCWQMNDLKWWSVSVKVRLIHFWYLSFGKVAMAPPLPSVEQQIRVSFNRSIQFVILKFCNSASLRIRSVGIAISFRIKYCNCYCFLFEGRKRRSPPRSCGKYGFGWDFVGCI